MLSSITWGQYFSAVALLLLAYYGFVAFRFYKWEILGVIGIKRIDGEAIATPTMEEFKTTLEGTDHGSYLPKDLNTIEISPPVQPFRDEIKAYLQEAVPWIEKPDLLNDLKLITSKYQALKTADYLSEVSTITLFEVNSTYPDIIQPNDVEKLWQ